MKKSHNIPLILSRRWNPVYCQFIHLWWFPWLYWRGACGFITMLPMPMLIERETWWIDTSNCGEKLQTWMFYIDCSANLGSRFNMIFLMWFWLIRTLTVHHAWLFISSEYELLQFDCYNLTSNLFQQGALNWLRFSMICPKTCDFKSCTPYEWIEACWEATSNIPLL